MTQIHFINMKRSESIESFVIKELSGLHVFGTHNPHFKVWLECEKSLVQKGPTLFRCGIEVDGIRGQKVVFVEKKDHDFYYSFFKALDALETIFRKDRKVLRNKERRQMRNLNKFLSAS